MHPGQKKNRWYSVSACAGVLLLGAVLRTAGLGWGLPEVFEEAMPLKRALAMWGWGTDRGLDLNPHFFTYPSLTIYLHFIVQGLTYLAMKTAGAVGSTVEYCALYLSAPTPMYMVARSVTVSFGVATIWITFLLGRKLGGLSCAIIASLLLAINTVHIATSQQIEVDVALTFFVALSIWIAVGLLESSEEKKYILYGVVLGLATSTKYTGAIIVLPLVVAHMISWRSSSAAGPRVRAGWSSLGTAVVVAIIVFYATSPYLLLDRATFLAEMKWNLSHLGGGHFGMDESPSWLFYTRRLAGSLLGWPACVLSLAGVIYLAGIKRRPWAIVISSFLVVYLIVIASWSMRADRYALPVVPLLLLLASAFVVEAKQLLPWSTKLRTGVAITATVAMVLPLLTGLSPLRQRHLPDSRARARAWFEQNVPTGSFIAIEPYGPNLSDPLQIASYSPEVRKLMTGGERSHFYAVQLFPMYQVYPERSSVFYRTELYAMADFIVTTGSMRSRYQREPDRFRTQVAFYDSLESNYEKVRSFQSEGGSGTEISVYRARHSRVPFAGRDSVAAPPTLTYGPGREPDDQDGYFYYNLGLNYATFGYIEPAIACYRQAIACPILPPGRYASLVEIMYRSVYEARSPGAAVSFLAQALQRAPTLAVRQRLARLDSMRPAPIK